MDITKILFCTSLSGHMDAMISRAFRLAYRYDGTLEIFHILPATGMQDEMEVKRIIESHIADARPSHLRNISFVIEIVRGQFKEEFVKRISKDDHLFILAGHTESKNNQFPNFADFLSTLSHSAAHTFIFKQSEKLQSITEMHYEMKFDYSDIRVLNALTTVGAAMEVTYYLHFSSKRNKKAKRDLKAISEVYGSRLHRNKANFEFVEHATHDFMINYEAHDIMVITKDDLIASAYDINQDPRAVLILNV